MKGMPAYSSPASRNKAKAVADITKEEIKRQEVDFNVCVQKKIVNDKPVIVATCNRWGYDPTEGTRVVREFTSAGKLKSEVGGIIDKAFEALA
jgi:hypothetical protein